MKKPTSVLLGAVVLAAIAPVLTLALLRAVGGTAQAQAPPATFWKVSMPDLGQHSDAWCWVGSGCRLLLVVRGQRRTDGLLGGAGEPWKNIEAASTNAGSACWYDARDAVDGLPAPVKGYPTVLRKIAESTFTDTNQNGIKDGVETNYCYGQGVEKWDYLIGLRDYVNSYGNNLAVHDIIDPAKCGIHTGLIVNRNFPTQNNLDPCGPGAVAPGGVPGVDQVAGPPAIPGLPDRIEWRPRRAAMDRARTWLLLRGDRPRGHRRGLRCHTVGWCLWPWEPSPSPTPGPTPPPPPSPPPGVAGASHTDALPGPWQSKPDHNNSPSHGTLPVTEPYNRCDVKQTRPVVSRSSAMRKTLAPFSPGRSWT